MERSRNHRLSLAILVVVLVVGAFANWRGYRDFVFEDAFIPYRYADNLARGEGFVFNPGERVLGTTTTLFSPNIGLRYTLTSVR
jgi:arabinofuranosyltransferase